MAGQRKLTYFCPCLNLRLQFKEPVQLVPRMTSSHDDNEDANENGGDAFFKHAFVVISSPNGVEITKKVDCLWHSREVDNWRITTCANCGTDTHATKSDDMSMVYVSDEMQDDTSAVEAMKELSDAYSPVYDILVRPMTTNEVHLNVFGMSSFSERPTVRAKLEELKQKAAQFLDGEKETMNERIRNFKKEQLFSFKEIESRVEHDRNILMQRIRSVADKHDRSMEPTGFQLVETNNESSAKRSLLTSRSAEKASGDEMARSFGRQSNFDVFAMDEDDVFSLSEPESSDSQEDCPSDDAPRSVDVNSRLYASSVPISMPMMWKRSIPERHISKNDDHTPPSEKDDFKTDDPQWMAASIQALAISVRGNDGTEMFGARPRPRLNTLD